MGNSSPRHSRRCTLWPIISGAQSTIRRKLTEVRVKDDAQVGTAQEKRGHQAPWFRRDLEHPGCVEQDVPAGNDPTVDEKRGRESRRCESPRRSASELSNMSRMPLLLRANFSYNDIPRNRRCAPESVHPVSIAKEPPRVGDVSAVETS